jgi:hypothetical protein
LDSLFTAHFVRSAEFAEVFIGHGLTRMNTDLFFPDLLCALCVFAVLVFNGVGLFPIFAFKPQNMRNTRRRFNQPLAENQTLISALRLCGEMSFFLVCVGLWLIISRLLTLYASNFIFMHKKEAGHEDNA